MSAEQARDLAPGSSGLTVTELEQRRNIVFTMRVDERLSFRTIAERVSTGVPWLDGVSTYEISAATAHADYWHVMRSGGFVADPSEVESHRADQLEQIDRMKAGLIKGPARITNDGEKVHDLGAFDGNVEAVNAYRRLIDTEAKLLGTYQPVKVTGPNGCPIQIDLGVPTDVLAGIVSRALDQKLLSTPN